MLLHCVMCISIVFVLAMSKQHQQLGMGMDYSHVRALLITPLSKGHLTGYTLTIVHLNPELLMLL